MRDERVRGVRGGKEKEGCGVRGPRDGGGRERDRHTGDCNGCMGGQVNVRLQDEVLFGWVSFKVPSYRCSEWR